MLLQFSNLPCSRGNRYHTKYFQFMRVSSSTLNFPPKKLYLCWSYSISHEKRKWSLDSKQLCHLPWGDVRLWNTSICVKSTSAFFFQQRWAPTKLSFQLSFSRLNHGSTLLPLCGWTIFHYIEFLSILFIHFICRRIRFWVVFSYYYE